LQHYRHVIDAHELAPGRLGIEHPNVVPYQAFEEPQVKARGMKVTLPHFKAGKVDVFGSTLRFSESKIEYGLAPPMVGHHTEEVLKGLG
jgi:crotonobetainyl-CoA:carnitine CoA-transferase CaiB-like acyl-CoA transferase